MHKQEHDVIIIGGGINGVGIARDCALRGLKVLLLEKHDFAKGASGNNTGMIHGGLRYMRYDVATTKASCKDSGFIQKIASHLLFRIPILFPVFKGDKMGRLLLEGAEIFFEAYDTFQPLKRGKKHTRLTPKQALQLEPGLSPNILGAVTLDEWGIDSFRLTLLNALDAKNYGAMVRNFCEVVGFEKSENGKISGVKFYDHVNKEFESHFAPIVVNATGVWGPKIASLCGLDYRLRYGKGIHVVFSHRLSNYGLIMNGVDGRQMFFIPHQTGTLIGTTDDDFYGDLDNPPVIEDEVSYVMEAAQRVFPSVEKHRKSHTWVGIRPTIFAFGKNEDVLSREHAILDHSADGLDGIISVTGGKLASYRQLAEEVTDVVAHKLGNSASCSTHIKVLPGAPEPTRRKEVSQQSLIEARARYRHADLLDTIAPTQEVCFCEPVTKEEIVHCVKNELVCRLSDLQGRTHLGLGVCSGVHCLLKASQILASEKQFVPQESLLQLEQVLDKGFASRRTVLEGANLAAEELARGAFFSGANLIVNFEAAKEQSDARSGLHVSPSTGLTSLSPEKCEGPFDKRKTGLG